MKENSSALKKNNILLKKIHSSLTFLLHHRMHIPKGFFSPAKMLFHPSISISTRAACSTYFLILREGSFSAERRAECMHGSTRSQAQSKRTQHKVQVVCSKCDFRRSESVQQNTRVFAVVSELLGAHLSISARLRWSESLFREASFVSIVCSTRSRPFRGECRNAPFALRPFLPATQLHISASIFYPRARESRRECECRRFHLAKLFWRKFSGITTRGANLCARQQHAPFYCPRKSRALELVRINALRKCSHAPKSQSDLLYTSPRPGVAGFSQPPFNCAAVYAPKTKSFLQRETTSLPF
jgi:hypothetical protein